MSSNRDSSQPVEPVQTEQSAEYDVMGDRIRSLVRERRLTSADLPDMLRFLALYGERDPLVRERFANVDETVQLLVSGTPQEQWMWLRFDHGRFGTGQGAVEQTLRVEFKDEKTMLGIMTGTMNPQVAALTGKVKVSPLARAAPFGEFFNLMSRRLSVKL
ncbi:MAG: hypothetical protein ACM3JD_14665 [Rudaea sp.]